MFMVIQGKSALALTAAVLVPALWTACGRDPVLTAPSANQTSSTTMGQANGVITAEGSTKGAAGQMPAFYDGALFTVNVKEMKPDLSRNPSVNKIYVSNDLDEEQDFIPVINAIQGDGFNPLWLQILIVFNPGFTPHQFVSDEQIEAAAAGANPPITLVNTGEVYRCSVVGRK
jgi:hypothetical protein